MNWPVIAMLLVIGGFAAGGWFGMDYKEKQYAASELERKQGWSDALDATATALAKVKIVQKTITNEVETRVKEVPIYQECKNTQAVIETINKAARGGK